MLFLVLLISDYVYKLRQLLFDPALAIQNAKCKMQNRERYYLWNDTTHENITFINTYKYLNLLLIYIFIWNL